MSVYFLKTLAKYNKITNEFKNNIIKEISEEQWNAKFNGFYRSIYELCFHIYNSDFNWLKWCKLLHSADENNYEYIIEDNFTNIDDYIFRRTELDKKIIEFINELSENDLEKTLKLVDSEGNKNEIKMGLAIIHIFNHATHHRGMISLYLEMLGKENDYSDRAFSKL